tara:strand:- start:272 stop:544 length:273 start_codon:yes stop_codon:yes gene_type:complete
MHSELLIEHPELQPLMKRFKKNFLKIHLEWNMMDLGWHGYRGMGLRVKDIKKIFEMTKYANLYANKEKKFFIKSFGKCCYHLEWGCSSAG